jgi:hypothetical protein
MSLVYSFQKKLLKKTIGESLYSHLKNKHSFLAFFLPVHGIGSKHFLAVLNTYLIDNINILLFTHKNIQIGF